MSAQDEPTMVAGRGLFNTHRGQDAQRYYQVVQYKAIIPVQYLRVRTK